MKLNFMYFYLGFDPFSEDNLPPRWQVLYDEEGSQKNNLFMPQNDFKSPGTVIGNYVSVKFYIGEAAYKKCQDGEKQLIDSLSSLYDYL